MAIAADDPLPISHIILEQRLDAEAREPAWRNAANPKRDALDAIVSDVAVAM